MSEHLAEIEYTSEPDDASRQLKSLAETLKQPLFYDELFLTPGDENPTNVLEARSDLFSWDRRFGNVTLSNLFDGNRIFDLSNDILSNSLKLSLGDTPLDSVTVEMSAEWIQKAEDQLVKQWPKVFDKIGPSASLKQSGYQVVQSKLKPFIPPTTAGIDPIKAVVRGRQTIIHAIEIAKAHLAGSSRCIEIEFEVPLLSAVDITLNDSVHIKSDKIPGGEVTGKVTEYNFSITPSGAIARIRLGVAAGAKENSIDLLPKDEGYAQEDYCAENNQTCFMIPSGIRFKAYHNQTPKEGILNPDGLRLHDFIKRVDVKGDAESQCRYLYENGYPARENTLGCLSEIPTVIDVELLDLRTKDRLEHHIHLDGLAMSTERVNHDPPLFQIGSVKPFSNPIPAQAALPKILTIKAKLHPLKGDDKRTEIVMFRQGRSFTPYMLYQSKSDMGENGLYEGMQLLFESLIEGNLGADIPVNSVLFEKRFVTQGNITHTIRQDLIDKKVITTPPGTEHGKPVWGLGGYYKDSCSLDQIEQILFMPIIDGIKTEVFLIRASVWAKEGALSNPHAVLMEELSFSNLGGDIETGKVVLNEKTMPIVYREHKGEPLRIKEICQEGDQLIIEGTFGRVFGPFVLPKYLPNVRGEWTSGIRYAYGDWTHVATDFEKQAEYWQVMMGDHS
eukprot:gene16831-17012_t